jgi:alkanesulfonate monooxygenase SsuD/methylene tetrahydromethanopterin reductase-like flavin-dependent oxidoreductase (luciferase family)
MNPRLRHFGCHIITSRYPVDEVLRLAVMVDQLSYDHVRIGDHVLVPGGTHYPNSHTILSALGVLTRRVRLFTAVTDSYRRHPVEIAQAIATLDIMTGGRAALGIGAGEEMNLKPFGIEWSKPVKRLKEAVDVIKLLWSATQDSPATYDGEIFKLRRAFLQIKPVHMPPVYLGASGPRTRELVGSIGDGWLPVAVESPQTLERHLSDVKRGARTAGRTLNQIDVDITVYTDVDMDVERSYQVVAPVVKSMLAQQREVLRELTKMEVPETLSLQRLDPTDRTTLEALSEISSRIGRSAVEQVAAFGPVDHVIGRLEAYLRAGATSLTICNLSSDQERVFQAYSKEIIPYLRETYGK